MPIYEYQCGNCGHDFEALQKISEGPLKKCPKCGALKLKRLVSAPQFRLKGTGWYETDFKKDGKKRLAGDGDGKPPSDDKKEEKKGEKKEKAAKPAADKDKKPASNAASTSGE